MTSKERRLLALILTLHAVVGALVLRYGTDIQDEGLLYAWGRRILDGQLPYTDFYLVQGVGTFYVQAALMKLFGMSFIVGRIFKQLEGLLLVYLAFVVLRRATGNTRAGLVAALATATFSAAHHYRMPWYSTDACLSVLLATYFACSALHSQKLRFVVAAGAALGLAMLFKHNHGVFAAAAIGTALVTHSWQTSKREAAAARVGDALTLLASLLGGTAIVVGGYLAYYVAAGGSLRMLWLNAFVWAREAKDFSSSAEMLFYPLKVFSLLQKQELRFPLSALLFLAGLFTLLWSRIPARLRPLGAVLIAGSMLFGPEVFVRVYILTFVNLLLFAIAGAAAWEALAATRESDPRRIRIAYSCFLVALVGAANAYGGTIPGGGWGRMVETWGGSLMAAGVGAYLICWHGGVVASAWKRTFWIAPKRLGIGLAAASVVISAGLLGKNQAFRPGLDVSLAAMTGETRSPGWRGLRGDPTFVRETDEVIDSLRALTPELRSRVFVYPLNSALYPLADARNVTRFDVMQIDFLAPSRFPEVLDELNRVPPAAIVYQRKPNASFAEDSDRWVRPPMPESVRSFLQAHYRKAQSWNYYELWLPASEFALRQAGS